MQRAKYLIIFLLSFFLNPTYAQDTGNFTQFFFNPYSLNPSFAGIDGRSALFAAYRKQWSGITGGPTLSNFSFHTPLKSGLSLGFNAANDQRGLLSNSGALVTLGYSISLGEDKYVRFGLSGGGSWNTIDLSKVSSQTIASDPALINLLNQNAAVIGNAGASLHLKSFHIGFALPNLFAPSYVSKDAFNVTEIKPLQAFVVHASNRFYFAKNKHVFEPYVVYRSNQGLPSTLEAAAVVHINHLIWVGGSWKQQFGMSALGGIKLNNRFAIGGSYTMKNAGVNELSFPSYEVHLSMLGGASNNKSKGKTTSKTASHTPYYSFIHTELPKKTRADLIHDNYVAAIAKADKALAAKNYEEARIDYYEAQKYKPTEAYPKTKIEEIGKLIAYESEIKKANTEFSAKSYEKALADYEAASNLNPTEKYPKEKIEEIKAMMAAKKGGEDRELKYKEAIAAADKAMAAKQYELAKSSYHEALGYKPGDHYPKTKLTEVEKFITYEADIKKADGELTSKSYKHALADYETAIKLNPTEQYPKQKIAEIKALLTQGKNAAELDKKYKESIAAGDKAMAAKQYELARSDYHEALVYKPAENYPKTKLAEAERVIAYQADIKRADGELSAKSYEQALADYEAASNLNPQEQYPKQKIAEIKAMLAQNKGTDEQDKKYRDAIAKADNAAAAKKYEEAELQYKEALAIKPGENYPKAKIEEVEKMITYQADIKKADSEFSSKSYEQALADYEAASDLNPNEKYPKDKIEEIKALIAATKVPVERHETIKRGGHPQELAPANYVIVGVFGSGPNAKSMARKLVESGINANYGFLTEKNLWYVHIYSGDDINVTRTERDKFRKQQNLSHAWLLTVHN